MESEFSIPGYNLYGLNISSKNFRGIIMYVHMSLIACQMQVSSLFQEFLVVLIKYLDKCMLTVGAFYRSPSSNSNNDEFLFELIDHLKTSVNDKLLMIGDFNLCDMNWHDWSICSSSNSAYKFLKCLRKNFFIQHVKFPTRARGTQTPSVLDLVISNDYFIDELHQCSPLGVIRPLYIAW